MITSRVIADSCSSIDESNRITSLVCRFPKFLLAQFNTHRVFSRSAQSSRAYSSTRLFEQIQDDPVMPEFWGKNQSGMEAEVEISLEEKNAAIKLWLEARDVALAKARELNKLGVHKQIVNRIVEPWMYATVIVTSTNWENFFRLRCDHAAQPEMQVLANKIREVIYNSVPKQLDPDSDNNWHLPFVENNGISNLSLQEKIKISVARCARVSYLNFEGGIDHEKDYKLYDNLLKSGHWSPFEHVATCLGSKEFVSRNFEGWMQYREIVDNDSK